MGMKTKAIVLAILTAGMVLTGVYGFAVIEGEQYNARTKAEIQSRLSTMSVRIESALNARLFLEKGVVAFVLAHLEMDSSHRITQEEFSRFGQQFMPQLLGIRNVSLIQNDIITHAYPLAGNERTIGLNFASVPLQYKDVMKVREQKNGMLFGPVDIVQGGVAIISRTPVFWTPPGEDAAKYWGQTSLVMPRDMMFEEAGIFEAEKTLIVVARNIDSGAKLWGIADESEMEMVSVDMKMPTGHWRLSAIPISGWPTRGPYFYWIWFWGGCLSVASGSLVWFLLKAKSAQQSLLLSEERFHILCEKAPVLINSTDPKGNILLWNAEAEKQLGYSYEEIKGLPHPLDLLYPEAGEAERVRAIIQQSQGTFSEFRPVAKNGTVHVQLWADMRLPNGDSLSVGHDVTDQKLAEEALRESEEKFRQMFTKQKAVMYLVNPETLNILDANESAQKFYGYSAERFKQLKVTDLNMKQDHEVRYVVADAIEGKFEGWEVQHRLSDGTLRDVEVRATLIRTEHQQFLFAIVHDITDRKKAEEQLRFVSFHDSLTRLYGRSFFEESIQRLDSRAEGLVGLIICDLDGLKLVNDTLGHEHGDQLLIAAASILQQCFPGNEIVSRIGGDEFAVILEGKGELELRKACEDIRLTVMQFNATHHDFHMSLSVGYAVGTGPEKSLREVFKEADNNMYREKLHQGQSARSAIVQTVMKLLAARDFITEGHADRLQDIVVMIGTALGLSESRLADLRLLAQFHDIGKVGIPDRILLKPGALTDEERIEMRRHCEIGHRIALTSPDLAPIADWILKHQEWWDGSGYPLGEAGEEIPLECRILAVADAYDAMTSDRPYRKAMPHEEAIVELKKFAGSQFDPRLVDIFIEKCQSTIVTN